MKFLLCLICLITVSCNAVIDPKSETIRSEDGYYIGTAHKFKFEGHDYISFTKERIILLKQYIQNDRHKHFS